MSIRFLMCRNQSGVIRGDQARTQAGSLAGHQAVAVRSWIDDVRVLHRPIEIGIEPECTGRIGMRRRFVYRDAMLTRGSEGERRQDCWWQE